MLRILEQILTITLTSLRTKAVPETSGGTADTEGSSNIPSNPSSGSTIKPSTQVELTPAEERLHAPGGDGSAGQPETPKKDVSESSRVIPGSQPNIRVLPSNSAEILRDMKTRQWPERNGPGTFGTLEETGYDKV
ncbi:hypothetical protein VKT23_020148 [Stygiomarasmius scandens]|uniref:Uncharacterized protein n=1 Tax=Marasmiellus scandens TaxID=2682957 RepID=A0ABR1INA5_9AGAR